MSLRDDLSRFLPPDPAVHTKAYAILEQLRSRTAPNTAYALDQAERAALPVIACLLACEDFQLNDLDEKTAQKTSAVAPKPFKDALRLCRLVIASTTSRSSQESPFCSPSTSARPTRLARPTGITFRTLAASLIEDVPQEVITWADTVKAMLREELLLKGLLGYRRADVLELLDEESTMRAVFGWVIRAWGMTPGYIFDTSSQVNDLLTAHVDHLRPQIMGDGRRYAERLLNPTAAHLSPGTSRRSPSTRSPSTRSPSVREVPKEPQTPTKPKVPLSPLGSAHTRRLRNTPTAPSPLKRQIRPTHDDDDDDDDSLDNLTDSRLATPTKGSSQRSKRKRDLDDDLDEDDVLLLASSRGKTTPTAKDKGKARALPTMEEDWDGELVDGPSRNMAEQLAEEAEERELAEEKRKRRASRRVRKHCIDGVSGIGVVADSIDKGWAKYLSWREGQLRLLSNESHRHIG